jgi:anion-transporting  ArsA/GET3 family ATPase
VSSSKHIEPTETERAVEIMYEVDYDSEHAKVRERLLKYRKKSEQIYKVGELIKEYEGKFTRLMEEKN